MAGFDARKHPREGDGKWASKPSTEVAGGLVALTGPTPAGSRWRADSVDEAFAELFFASGGL